MSLQTQYVGSTAGSEAEERGWKRFLNAVVRRAMRPDTWFCGEVGAGAGAEDDVEEVAVGVWVAVDEVGAEAFGAEVREPEPRELEPLGSAPLGAESVGAEPLGPESVGAEVFRAGSIFNQDNRCMLFVR